MLCYTLSPMLKNVCPGPLRYNMKKRYSQQFPVLTSSGISKAHCCWVFSVSVTSAISELSSWSPICFFSSSQTPQILSTFPKTFFPPAKSEDWRTLLSIWKILCLSFQQMVPAGLKQGMDQYAVQCFHNAPAQKDLIAPVKSCRKVSWFTQWARGSLNQKSTIDFKSGEWHWFTVAEQLMF